MVDLRPFAALRPDPALAAQICELPYDVLSSEEARQAASSTPLSFFHVSKPEIDFPPGTDPYLPQVYEQAHRALRDLIERKALVRDERPSFYLYRQVMGAHSQLGLVAVASCQDYLDNRIRKHELTRPEKEDDRVRHIETLNAQTGPVFLISRAQPQLDDLLAGISQDASQVDFTASDGVRHTGWVISDQDRVDAVSNALGVVSELYIADGHHRCAAAARVCQTRAGAGSSAYFLAVIFPHTALQILPYHRVLKDLHGRSAAEILSALKRVGEVVEGGSAQPVHPHEIGFYMEGRWRSLRFAKAMITAADPFERLDVTWLQNHVLAPLFGIDDPRTSTRIQFVGGIRGTAELERLVDKGEGACAFALYPTGVEQLMDIADAGGIMPPKSTWFEPKLRDAMFTHLI